MTNFLPEGYTDPNERRKRELLRGYREKLKTNPIYALYKLNSFGELEEKDLHVAYQYAKSKVKVLQFAQVNGFADYTDGDEGTGQRGA